jgi:polyvinyl alcohol dehydrogenase (cytochrome)
MMALDVNTGEILWRTYTAPEPTAAEGPNGGYTGNAIWGSTASIDPKRNQLYVTTGNNYSVPDSVAECVAALPEGADAEGCVSPDNHFDSIMALDLDTGAIKWATHALPIDAWNVSCGIPFIFDEVTPNCPDSPGPDWDFGQGPALFSVKTARGKRDLVGAGQKSGVYWALDPSTGAVVWSTQASPGGIAGGLQWGSAVDGSRVYVGNSNAAFKAWTQIDGPTVYSGGWSALDAVTGAILWDTPDPAGSNGMGPVSGANGVIYACSLGAEGHMYAMDAASGDILWDFASGAACLGGAAIAGGQVFWGYGYDAFSPVGPQPDQGLYAFALPD